MTSTRRVLIVLLGATGVGKTELSLELAHRLGSSIVSADSRQLYREIPIGTAAPSPADLGRAPHYLIGTKSIQDYYSASLYEQEALSIITTLHQDHPYAILSGGSMMYIDAVCKGIDMMPDVDPGVRQRVYARYEVEGLEGILEDLKVLDPIYYDRVDKRNYKRVLHGYEMCLSTGKPFSSFRTGQVTPRPFSILKIGLHREREELYQRIDSRVLWMMEQGLLEEAERVAPYRALNALNTVGYKELFAYMDGKIDLDEAVRQIQSNSRLYARKQLTWWRRDDSIVWCSPEDLERIYRLVTETR